MSDENLLRRARRAAELHMSAVRDVERFIAHLGSAMDAGTVAEFANLLAREEATLADRQDALAALGLDVPSVES
jgi:hypothetical protein